MGMHFLGTLYVRQRDIKTNNNRIGRPGLSPFNIIFINSHRGLKWLAVCMVSAEILNCKLVSTQAFVLYRGGQPIVFSESDIR